MSKRSSSAGRVIGVTIGALILAAMGFALAVAVFMPGLLYTTTSSDVTSPGVAYPYASDAQKYAGVEQRDVAATEEMALSAAPEASDAGGSAGVDTMVIRTAAMEVRVDEVDSAIEDVRAAAKANDGEVTSLSVQSGSDGMRPLQEGVDGGSNLSPASAYITIRVPADQLEQLSQDIAETGTVLSQSASADDVTEQYIDLSARLKNLRAEEARLRTFFDQAKNVKDLLAVQSELARVRGEIEAMQAQVDYLERQVAKATLNVTLTEPGPIVRPGAADWGFGDAITRGVQAAAALVNWLIVAAIALLPIALVALLVWLVVRALRKRRGAQTPAAPYDDGREANDAPDSDEPGGGPQG